MKIINKAKVLALRPPYPPSLLPLFFFIMLNAHLLSATEHLEKAEPPPPGEPCQTEPLPGWTGQEQWVWKQICQGLLADFNKKYGGQLDPTEPAEWPTSRVLRPAFLETILLHEPWRSVVPHSGIRIRGAWFKDPLDLSYAELSRVVWLTSSRFDATVTLRRLRTSRLLSLGSSVFRGRLDMAGLKADSDLLMHMTRCADVDLSSATVDSLNMINADVTGFLNMNGLKAANGLFLRSSDKKARFTDIDLRSARVSRALEMDNATVTGFLNMNGLNVSGQLLMRGAIVTRVDLWGAVLESLEMDNATIKGSLDLSNAKVGGQLRLIDTTVTGPLIMESLHVDSSLIMHTKARKARFADVNLRAARIRGHLNMTGATVTGPLIMKSFEVGGDLLMNEMTVEGNASAGVDMVFTRIGNNLDLTGARLPSLNLTGSRLGGELRLAQGDKKAHWQAGAALILHNTVVATLLHGAPIAAWPNTVDLEGFTYNSLGRAGADETNDTRHFDMAWFDQWLGKQPRYSPQPYEQLSGILQKMGRKDKAKDILYAGKNRELSESSGFDWIGLFLLKIFIGYGYCIYYAIGWVLWFIVLGVLVLKLSKQGPKHNMPYGLAYSFDMLLPLIKLREHHYNIEPAGWARYYFYVHKIMGYVLASFLIAGLSGLTK